MALIRWQLGVAQGCFHYGWLYAGLDLTVGESLVGLGFISAQQRADIQDAVGGAETDFRWVWGSLGIYWCWFAAGLAVALGLP